MSTVDRKQIPTTPAVAATDKVAKQPASQQPADSRPVTGAQPTVTTDEQALGTDKGPRTSIGLPGQPGAAAAPVPPYAKSFGSASYVKDGGDGNLVGLARRVAATSPELANGAFGKNAKLGKLSADDVKTLQKHLESKGYSVGEKGTDGKYGPQTHRALAAYLAGEQPVDGSKPVDGEIPAGGPMQGAGMEKDGLRIPAGEGRATTFWNGHMAYKGKYDMNNRQNKGLGAWGDKNAPTDYFVALPVKDKKWHNQKILITNPATGQQVVARVQDKGPGASTGAKIDLSPVTMEAIGGNFKGDLKRVKFEFAPADAPVGPVRR